VIIRDGSLDKAIRWSQELSHYFSEHAGQETRVLGPASAPLARLKGDYRFQILLKARSKSVLPRLLSGALSYAEGKEIPQSALLVDMDPLQLL